MTAKILEELMNNKDKRNREEVRKLIEADAHKLAGPWIDG